MKKSRIKSFDIKIETDFDDSLKVTYLCPREIDYFIINDAIDNKNTKFKRLQKYIAKKVCDAFCDRFDNVMENNYNDFHDGAVFVIDMHDAGNPIVRLVNKVKFLKYINQKGYSYRLEYDKDDNISKILINGKHKF